MMPEEKIERLIKKINVTPRVQMHNRTLEDVLGAQEKSKNEQSDNLKPNIWRIIMKNPMTKFATVAAIIIAVLFCVNQFTGSIDLSSVAWADVVNRVSHVDYIHVYWFKSRDDNLRCDFEAWYSNGKMVMRGKTGDMIYDDGRVQQGFDRQKRYTGKEQSFFAKGQPFFEVITVGLLSHKNKQFTQQIPSNVGDDFLIYDLDPPPDEGDFLENITITVGKSSLLPVQMKIYQEGSDYDLVLFDYEAPEKPKEFFEPPAADASNGSTEIVLDGPEVVIDLVGADGIKQAIVRLHGKFDGSIDQIPEDSRFDSMNFRRGYKRKGGPVFKLDASFVTDEGYPSGTNDIIVLRLDETPQCGVGSADGGKHDNWPDGKYRNIKFYPTLKATDQDGVYFLEMRCRLLPK
jgi:hypothetical protein